MFSRTIVLSTLSITREVVKQDCPKEKERKSHTNISETFPGTDRLADVLTQVHAHSLTHSRTHTGFILFTRTKTSRIHPYIKRSAHKKIHLPQPIMVGVKGSLFV